MNAHQRRVARRLYERVFGDHVDYNMTVFVPKEPKRNLHKHPTRCEHCGAELEMQWDEDRWCYLCASCYAAVAVRCPMCGGNGFLPENEAELDWINFGDDLITCPECDGEGWTADPSFQ